MTESAESFPCQLCDTVSLSEVDGFNALMRVTSDCKPWTAGGRLFVCGRCGALQKRADAAWREEIARIYAAFEIYHQAGGAEQYVFGADGDGLPRSVTLAEFLAARLDLTGARRVLDLGCGNGMTLASFSRRFPPGRCAAPRLTTRRCPDCVKFRVLNSCSLDRSARSPVNSISSPWSIRSNI